jgi:serine/threonine-protein kinase
MGDPDDGGSGSWPDSTVVMGLGPADREGSLAPGTLLNGIYEVRRLIARGGMGEVFEGANVNSDERVAIKVILPHLAADQNVRAMFRKEAGILTRITHPAIAQYRVLAQDSAHRILYIVTEYIDGIPLSARMAAPPPAAEAELVQLTRRLASGLEAAHELGAVHRDITPDNVLLPGGRLDKAKIIDFGIAKDLEASHTIIGHGFAGTLGYVAPEQFGEYGREIGPWTDVYSLGLVILCVARGRASDMGATVVDAIDMRRKGVDVSAAPERLRPILGRMLESDPARRFRSMREVLEALDGPASGATAAPEARPAAPRDTPPPSAAGPAQPGPASPERAPRPPALKLPALTLPRLNLAGAPAGLLLGAGGALLVAGAGIAAVAFWPKPSTPGLAAVAPETKASAPAPEIASMTNAQPAAVEPEVKEVREAEPAPGPARKDPDDTHDGPAPPPNRDPEPPKPKPQPGPSLTKPLTLVVFFPWDQTGVTPEGRQVVAQAAAYATAGNGARVRVVGHTDTSMSAAYSAGVSQRRARAVADALISLGVPSYRVSIDWMGSKQLAVPTADGVKEPLNRRVEIFVEPFDGGE